jgi:hypothetical protein
VTSPLSDACLKAVLRMGAKYQIAPADLLLVWTAESGLNPAAVNPNGGAAGLNQMMPATLRGMGMIGDLAAVLEGIARSSATYGAAVARLNELKGETPMPDDPEPTLPPRVIAPEEGEGMAARIVAAATSYAGTGASSNPDRYLELLMGPGDTDKNAFLGMSSCALFARGVMRIAGVDHPILKSAYRVQHAVSDVLEIGQSKDAYVTPSGETGAQPREGDIFWIKTPGKNDDHVEVIVDVRAPWTFTTVAGGQGARGNESGLFEREPWTFHGGAPHAGARQVMGWLDARSLVNPTRAGAPKPQPVPAPKPQPRPSPAPSRAAQPVAAAPRAGVAVAVVMVAAAVGGVMLLARRTA